MTQYNYPPQPFYTHFYDTQKRPRVTVCYLDDDEGTAVGIAICSLKDMPHKRVGRAIASQRASYALENKEDVCVQIGCYWPISMIRRGRCIDALLSTDFPSQRNRGIFKDVSLHKIVYIYTPQKFRFQRN